MSPVTCHLSPIPFHLSPFTYNIAHFTCPMSIVTLPLSHVIYHLSPVTTAPQSGYLGYLRYQKIILLFSLEITFKVPQKRVFLKELCSFTETSYCVTKTVSDGNQFFSPKKCLFLTKTNLVGENLLKKLVFITETNFCPSFFQRNILLTQKNVLVAEKCSPMNTSFCQKRKFCHRSKLIESYYARPSDFPPVEKRC